MKKKKNKEKDEFRAFLIAITIIAVIVVIFVGFVTAAVWYSATTNSKANIYPLLTTVTEINKDKDIVTVEDNNGFIWQFKGVDDWEKGDLCNCLMDSQGTEKVFDDEIITTRYESGAK